jgi:hypothetical protein
MLFNRPEDWARFERASAKPRIKEKKKIKGKYILELIIQREIIETRKYGHQPLKDATSYQPPHTF